MVGSSWNSADVSGVAPIRSPADTKIVLGLVARSWSTCVARYSTPPAFVAPIRPPEPVGGSNAPWKSLRPRIWIFVVWALPARPGLGSPAAGPAVAVTISPNATSRVAGRASFFLIRDFLHCARQARQRGIRLHAVRGMRGSDDNRRSARSERTPRPHPTLGSASDPGV